MPDNTPQFHSLVAGAVPSERADGPAMHQTRPDDAPCEGCGEDVPPTRHPGGTGWMQPTALCDRCDLRAWRTQWQAEDLREQHRRCIEAADVPDRAWTEAGRLGIELPQPLDRMTTRVPPGERRDVSGVYMWGDVGTGKSVRAALAIKTYLRRWILEEGRRFSRHDGEPSVISARYCNPNRLLERHKASFNGGPRVDTDTLIECDLLVFDDVGTEPGKPGESGSDWARSQIYLIVNGRYEQRKLTIFTANYALTKAAAKSAGKEYSLEDHYNYTQRTTSRIYEMCGGSAGSLMMIHLNKSWRKPGGQA